MPPSPLWDPLQFAVEEAHRRGMELHAWFNPYRAVRSVGHYSIDSTHVSVRHPDWILTFAAVGSTPAAEDPRPRTSRKSSVLCSWVVADIVRRYDVDGVHADDYFYPYSPQDISSHEATRRSRTTAGASATSAIGGGTTSTSQMKMILDSLAAIKPYVKFGMSPFGIWKNGVPAWAFHGLDAYSSLYADAIAWLTTAASTILRRSSTGGSAAPRTTASSAPGGPIPPRRTTGICTPARSSAPIPAQSCRTRSASTARTPK